MEPRADVPARLGEKGEGMGAARAYSYYPDSAERAPERQPYRRPDINVVPGGRAKEQDRPLSPTVYAAAKLVAGLLVFVAVVAFARVGLSAAAIEAAVEGDELSAQISEAQSDYSYLEVSASVLSNTSRLKQEAAALGMTEVEAVEVITLEADVVTCDEAGNLSLSLSIAQAAALAE